MNKKETIVLGGGCFWCTEAIFKMLRGVVSVTPGYAGGTTENPTNDQVYSGITGHAEVIRVEYDSSVIALHDLLDIFFHLHDPTSLNRQGNDVGTQYRSIILYTTDEQKNTAGNMLNNIPKAVTEIKPLEEFYPAESYHMDYYAKNSYQPYCQFVINPKLQKLRKQYSDKLV